MNGKLNLYGGLKGGKATRHQVAIVLCIKEITEYLYQIEAVFPFTTRDK